MGITALDLHHYLIDVGFLYRERNTYELKLCKRYAGLGYAKTRSHFRYNSKGDLVETRFPVWTEKGLEFIRKLIKGQGTTNDTNLTNCFYGKNC
jgi:phage antirepressor YoqD-like protein